jgi:hypothetical protein
MNTPSLSEIGKPPHSFSGHIAAGFGTNVSEVFGKSILSRTQLTEEHHALATILASSGIVDEISLGQMQSRFVEKQKLCEQISVHLKKRSLLESASNKQKAMKPTTVFVQFMNALREHVRESFKTNLEDIQAFVQSLQDTIKHANTKELSEIVFKWQQSEQINDDDIEKLKILVFAEKSPIEFNMVLEKVIQHVKDLKRSELELLPMLPKIDHITYEDVDVLKWLLYDEIDKSQLAALFLRVSGIAVRNHSRAPTFVLVLHYIDNILKLFVGILNFKNAIMNTFHIPETTEIYQKIVNISTEQFSCAVELAAVIGLPLSSEFFYYESQWKAYALEESAFSTVGSIQKSSNPENLWVLHWYGNDMKTLSKDSDALENIPAQEIKFRLQHLIEPKTPASTESYFIKEWDESVEN